MPEIVGARHHEELWIPAEELDALNDAIVGKIYRRCALPGPGITT